MVVAEVLITPPRGGGGGAGGYRELVQLQLIHSPLDGSSSRQWNYSSTATAYPITVGGGGAGDHLVGTRSC